MQRRAPAKQQPSSSKKKWLIAAVILLLLLSATGAWAMWTREDPQLTKVRDMLAQIEDAPWDQRRKQFEGVRPEMEKLTEEQRDELRDERRQRWEEREAQEMKKFFAMPHEQQIAELDKQIDRMEAWRKKREKEGDRRRGGPNGGNRFRGGGRSFGQDANGGNAAVDRSKRSLDRRSADSRAQRDQYRRMMADRMRQRGIRGFGRG
jgi:hypothetical protein